MDSGVTQKHFDATIGELRREFVTKDHFNATIAELRSDFMTRFDEMISILRRLDEERVFTLERIQHIEADVSRIKDHLHLA